MGGRYQGCHMPTVLLFLGSPPLLCPLWTLVLPGAHFTVMLVLSQDRTTWFSNDGVLNHNKTWGLLRTH